MPRRTTISELVDSWYNERQTQSLEVIGCRVVMDRMVPDGEALVIDGGRLNELLRGMSGIPIRMSEGREIRVSPATFAALGVELGDGSPVSPMVSSTARASLVQVAAAVRVQSTINSMVSGAPCTPDDMDAFREETRLSLCHDKMVVAIDHAAPNTESKSVIATPCPSCGGKVKTLGGDDFYCLDCNWDNLEVRR